MNVLIICTEKLPVPPVKGGAIQTYIAGAVPTLSKHHQITILGRDDEALPDEETKDGIHYVRIPGGLLETYRDGVVNYLQKKGTSYDLIHVFNRPRLVHFIRMAAPNARIILSMHNDMFKPEKIDAEEGALAIRDVDKIITISKYIGQAILDYYPEAAPKLRTIYSGVDLHRFVPSYTKEGQSMRHFLRKEYLLESKKVILFAGRLSPNKGVDVLVRAMPELSKKIPNVALVIMGGKWFSDDGITDYIAYVRSLAARSPIPIITTGFVAPDKIQGWFAAADVFVCPSQWQEPLARVHYEAMAAGLPIITTARGGNAEVMESEKNGLIIENPENPAEFTKCLSYLLSQPKLCNEMGRYGRMLAEKNYNWNRVVNEILEVWDEIEYNVENNVIIGEDYVVELNEEDKQEQCNEKTTESVEKEVRKKKKRRRKKKDTTGTVKESKNWVNNLQDLEKKTKDRLKEEFWGNTAKAIKNDNKKSDEVIEARKRRKADKRYRVVYNRPQVFRRLRRKSN